MKNLPTLRNDSSFAVLFKKKIKHNRNVWTTRKNSRVAICWISSDNPAKICHNYTWLCECLDTQPIKITTPFTGSEGRHWAVLSLSKSVGFVSLFGKTFIAFYICCYPISTIMACLFSVGVRISWKELCWKGAWGRKWHLVSPTLYIIIVYRVNLN